MTSLLKQSLDIISDKKLFYIHGLKSDQETLRQLLHLIIQTKVGRQLILKIGTQLKQSQNNQKVSLSIIRASDNHLAIADEDLNIKLVRIDTKDMTPIQRHKTALLQALTLIHELAHINQVLRGDLCKAEEFPLPLQAYLHVLHEAEATLFERKLGTELAKLYPRPAKSLRLHKPKFHRPVDLIRSFFVQNKRPFGVLSGLDVFAENMKNSEYVPLTNVRQKHAFAKWINGLFSNMNIPLTYQQMPLETAFWTHHTEDHTLTIEGWDSFAAFDSAWRLIALSKGLDRDKESAVNIALFVYAGQHKQLTNAVHYMQKNYPQARIYLAKGLKQKRLKKAAKDVQVTPKTR